MNKIDSNELTKVLSSFFDFCGLKQNELALRAYTKAFIDRDWNAEKAKEILSIWIEKHGRKMPAIADLDEMVSDSTGLNARQLAVHITHKIQDLITKHGYMWSDGEWTSDGGPVFEGKDGIKYTTFEKALESYVGQFAYLISSRWQNLCQSWDENSTTNFAQLRDMIEAEIALSDSARKQAIAIVFSQKRQIKYQENHLLEDKNDR